MQLVDKAHITEDITELFHMWNKAINLSKKQMKIHWGMKITFVS